MDIEMGERLPDSEMLESAADVFSANGMLEDPKHLPSVILPY